MKAFKGKAIYNPSGKAGEYSYWACNFFIGCSNDCSYCYCKKGVLASAMGGNVAKLKACFKNEVDALQVFEKELKKNLDSLRKHGLFFTFTSDPMLPKCISLTKSAIQLCCSYKVPVKILTKRADWICDFQLYTTKENMLKYIAFGFTLTGHNELEPGASTNAERIEAMAKLHEAGFKTFASIEPIIDFESSKEMIRQTAGYCDLYKIGLLSGKKYDKKELIDFIEWCNAAFLVFGEGLGIYRPMNYFKDSLLEQAGLKCDDLPANCVTRKYNIFTGGDECLMECTSCDKKFDIEDMEEDDGGNWFCQECWEELAPVMKAEYEELVAKGEIES